MKNEFQVCQKCLHFNGCVTFAPPFLCIENPIYVCSICFTGLSLKLFYKKIFLEIPKCLQSRYKLNSPPPSAKLDLQLNYRATNLNNQLKAS